MVETWCLHFLQYIHSCLLSIRSQNKYHLHLKCVVVKIMYPTKVHTLKWPTLWYQNGQFLPSAWWSWCNNSYNGRRRLKAQSQRKWFSGIGLKVMPDHRRNVGGVLRQRKWTKFYLRISRRNIVLLMITLILHLFEASDLQEYNTFMF